MIQETTDNSEERFQGIRSGLLEFAVLSIISSGEVYAAEILARLAPTPLHSQEGTLYPLLSKLRREGLLEYEWRESDAGPPRKYYALTAKGSEQLFAMKAYWHSITSTITKLGR